MVPLDAFRQKVQDHQRDLSQVQDSVSYARKIISKEKDIGPGQCARIVNSIRSVEEPLREFYLLLDTPELLPLPARPFRHPLLIILDNASELLRDVIHNISSLYLVYRTASDQEADMYRQQILEQLEALDQKKEDIVRNSTRLLLKAHMNR